MNDNLLDPRVYLPDLYQHIREIDVLSEAALYVLSYIRGEYMQILANQFVMSADIKGITRFEGILGIMADSMLDLESRRQRVLSKMATSTVFTEEVLRQNIKNMCDNGVYELLLDYDTFHAALKVRMGKKGMLEVLYDMLYTMLPAHASFEINNALPAKSNINRYAGGVVSIKKCINLSMPEDRRR